MNPPGTSVAPFAEMARFLGGQARLLHVPVVTDPRGSLLPFDFAQMPFVPRHSFTIANVPAGTVRGGHSHRDGEQLLICLKGAIDVRLRYRGDEQRVALSERSGALHVASNVWAEQTYVEAGSVLLSFMSKPYDAGSYDAESS